MTPTAAGSSLPTVEMSWARIDAWLTEHAPLSRALLRPPASPDDIAAAEQRLGVAFPTDLVASLRCHDGVEEGDAAPVFALNGPFGGVADIVDHTLFLRSIGEDLSDLFEDDDEDDEDDDSEASELNAYWRDEWLLITRGIGWDAQDGLFLTCRKGSNYGRIGDYFNEDAPAFSEWASLPAALSFFADALERRLPVGGQVPLAVDGALVWDHDTTTVTPQPYSLLTLAAGTPEPGQDPDPEPGPRVPERTSGSYLTVSLQPAAPPLPEQPDLVFVSGTAAPHELLLRVGVAQQETVRERTHRQARRSAAGTWAACRPLVRAGRCGTWGYVMQSAGAKQLTRAEVLRRLSRGTRAVALTKQGPDVRVTVYENGAPHSEGALDQLVSSAREDRIRLPDGTEVQRVGVDIRPGSTAAYGELLAALLPRFGIAFDLEGALDEPLSGGLVLPVMADIPEWSRRPTSHVREFDLAAVVERTPPPRFRAALTAQLHRLAGETGLDSFPEVSHALAAIDRGDDVSLAEDDPLDLRMREIAAEAFAAGQALEPSWRCAPGTPELPSTQDDHSAWQLRVDAADALRCFLQLPAPVAAAKILHRRLSADWRTELAHDLDMADRA